MAIPKNQKNSKYWDLRSKAERDWITQNIKNDEEFNAKLKDYYDRAILKINRTIESELSRLAKKENIDINELKQRVKDFDVQEYSIEAKRIVEEADKLRKQGRNVTYEDFSKEINERLRLYNATMRINRQELLKSLIGLNLIELGAKIDANLRQKLTKDYTDEITRQAGILGEFKHPIWTGKEVAKIVMAQTGSANFSKRIWANQDALKARLDASLSVALIQGQNPRKMAQQLRDLVSKEVTNARYATERIARTESARVQTQAQLKSFRDNGYKFCKWHAEPSACKICREIAENGSGYGVGVYRVDEVPSLPAHPNCRCGLSAYWVDEEDIKINSPIPFKNILDKLKSKKYTETFSNYPNNIDYYTSLFATENMKKVLGVNRAKEISYRLSMAPDKYQKLYLRNKDKIIFANDLNNNKVNNYFLRTDKKIHLKSDAFTNRYGDRYDIVFHEIAHDFFNNEISVTSSYNIGEVIRKKVIKNVDILIAEKSPQLIGVPKDSKAFSIALNNSIFSYENVTSYTGLVADIYKAVSGVELSYGHESGYFDEPGNLEREFFAGAISMEINNASGAEFNRIIFPESLKIIDEMVDSLLESE